MESHFALACARSGRGKFFPAQRLRVPLPALGEKGNEMKIDKHTALAEPDAEARLALLRSDHALEAVSDPTLDRWVATVRRQTRVVHAALALVHGARQVVRVASDEPGTPAERVTELACDLSLETYLRGLTAGGQSGAFAATPIVVAGSVLGQIAIADGGRKSWSAEELALLTDAAAGVAAELDRRMAKIESDRIQQLLASHNRVHDMIGRGTPLHDVLVEICRTIERYDPSFMASVLMRDPKSNTLHSAVGPSFPKAYLDAVEGAPIGPNIGSCGPAAWFGKFTVSADLSLDPKWGPILPVAALAGVAHCWSMPIKDGAGEVLGTLALYGRRPREPQPEHAALMQDWARVAGTAIERAKSMDRLTHDARHDSLTGLPNRAAIFETLDASIQRVRPGTGLAVLFVDLDGLKAMNDTLGHDVADEMIREVAQRLAKNVRGRDFVGRFGGDEFIVIATEVGEPDEARHLAARLLSSVAQPLPGLESRVVTASIGITFVRSNDAEAREVIRKADAAMYEAKRTGRDRCVFAEAGEDAPAGRRLQLARDLRGAEMRGELHLVYQPIVALPSLELVGVEALLRWASPVHGAVGPSEFIPIAEDTGSILSIGAWVLRESCETLSRLAQAGHRLELSVNVSARQLSQPEFPLWVRQTLSHAEFPAALLNLELTETALLRPDSITVANLRELDALGVRVVLDDFGTGYSSLAWLRDHPLSTIKIDRGFVAGIHERNADRVIVAGVTRMAKDLGCCVTAEGIETEQQLKILESLGCDRAQGYLFARPVGADALENLLAQPRHPDPL